jgi:hypothetical protein
MGKRERGDQKVLRKVGQGRGGRAEVWKEKEKKVIRMWEQRRKIKFRNILRNWCFFRNAYRLFEDTESCPSLCIWTHMESCDLSPALRQALMQDGSSFQFLTGCVHLGAAATPRFITIPLQCCHVYCFLRPAYAYCTVISMLNDTSTSWPSNVSDTDILTSFSLWLALN